MAAPAFAQGTGSAAESDSGLTEIIVTARKVEERLQDVPVAVTVLSGDNLRDSSIQKVEDIAAFTPGLAIRQGQSTPAALTLALRGQVQTDILATLDPSVGTYVDGVYWARAYGLNGGFLDVNAVQVLKGPQGTLFGRNTTGGALLINSNDPKMDRLAGEFSATYGRFNEFEATGVVNAPLGDVIAVRLAAKRTSRNGYTTNSVPAGVVTVATATTPLQNPPFVGTPNGVKLDNRDRWQLRGKVLIQPTSSLKLLFSAEYFDMNEDTPSRELRLATATFNATNAAYNLGSGASTFVGVGLGNGPATAFAPGQAALNTQIAFLDANPNLTSNNEVSQVMARTHTYNFTGSLDTDWGQVKLLAGIRDVKSATSLDLEGSQYAIHITEGDQKLKQSSAELQVTGRAFNNALNFAVGGFVFKESGYDTSLSITTPTLNPNTSHFAGIIDNDSIGIYGQGTWHFTDKFSFTGGLRYSVDDKGLETRNNNYNRTTGNTTCSVVNPTTPFNAGGEVISVPQCSVIRKDKFSGVSYTAGFEYKPNNDLLLYIKTSKGFRSGGQNLRAPNLASFIPFKPEIAYAYEVGLKAELLDRKLRVNLAAYQTDVSNIQRSALIATPPAAGSTVPGTATILSNAGKARFRGMEGELTALLAQGLTVSASGAIVDPKYVSFADLTGDRSFERFTGVAKSQFALGLDYKGKVSEDVKVGFHVDYTWRGDVPTAEYNWVANPANPNGATTLPGILIVNAAATGGAAGSANTQNQAVINATTAKALGLLGARASITFKDNYELAVFGRNITNNRQFIQNLLVAPLGYITGIRQEPATYGVTMSVKF